MTCFSSYFRTSKIVTKWRLTHLFLLGKFWAALYCFVYWVLCSQFCVLSFVGTGFCVLGFVFSVLCTEFCVLSFVGTGFCVLGFVFSVLCTEFCVLSFVSTGFKFCVVSFVYIALMGHRWKKIQEKNSLFILN